MREANSLNLLTKKVNYSPAENCNFETFLQFYNIPSVGYCQSDKVCNVF